MVSAILQIIVVKKISRLVLGSVWFEN